MEVGTALPELSPAATFAVMSGILLVRYFAVCGAAWALAWKRGPVAGLKRLDRKDPDPSTVQGEIAWSMLTSLIFAAVSTFVILGWHRGWVKVYLEPAQHGWLWFAASLPVLLLLHETYFYWTHRWMHRQPWFGLMHAIHHRSSNPTPWASFSFHPSEALVQALILPLLLLVLPVHWGVLAAFLTIMTVNGVLNHLGYEVYPDRWLKSGKLDGWITATHHHLHHRNPAWHFGLYFTFWDRWMGTQKPAAEPASEAGEFDADVLIAGAGLAGGAIAWFLADARPELKILLLERDEKAGGNHTWSFHSSDLDGDALRSIGPWVSKSWPTHEVMFPLIEREISTAYSSIRSERFHEALVARFGGSLITRAVVTHLTDREAWLGDGRKLRARVVIDCRGFAPELRSVPMGFQKFLGLDLLLSEPHGLTQPMLMDATVPQTDGFRFFYLLPWDERRLLVEDTRYSDSPAIDEREFEDEIRAYCTRRGWQIEAVERREVCALPIPLGRARLAPSQAARAGTRAALFHPTTGYSFPDAIRVAKSIASLEELSTQAVGALVSRYRAKRRSAERFYLGLNRMLFGAAMPEKRYRVLERFYGLPEPLISRFYSGENSWVDRARILAGRPPVPVLSAARAVLTRPKGIQ